MTDTTAAAGGIGKPSLPTWSEIGLLLRRGDLALAICVLAILVVLILPLPPVLLDLCLAL